MNKFIACFFLLSFVHSQGQNSTVLTYGFPKDVGLDSSYIHSKVDSIMSFGIKNNAFPGAQLLVAKNNKIIFHEAYGFHTYDSIQKVGLNDVYDLASVTKILGPLPALMKLVDENKLVLDAPFSDYWEPWQKRKVKKHLTLREILAHQAGLKPYIVFLSDVLKNEKLKKRFVSNTSKNGFRNQIDEELFIKDKFKNKMYRQINRSNVKDKKEYVYSGLSFLIYPEMIANISNISYDQYLQDNFYKPLGLETMGFLPKTKSFNNHIVPTEMDTIFRKTQVHEWVHDENAALLGGISGNAGLFSNAKDLAIIMQMYMQYGIYDGKRYFKETIVKEFTKVQYPENDNRRGLGFDKPLLNNSELPLSKSYPAPKASSESFGHSGFTGTFVWADPINELVFIFLSNRVYPTRKNTNLYDLNIRPALHQVFYSEDLIKTD